MTARIGVQISWKSADLVLVEGRGPAARVLREIHADRGHNFPGEALRRLLEQLPAECVGIPLCVGLSFADTACSLALPREKAASRSIESQLALLRLEESSAGETLEELAADVLLRGGQAIGVAVRNDVLRPILDAARETGHRLDLVTSSAAALALSLPGDGRWILDRAGEVIEVERSGEQLSWRSYPSVQAVQSSPLHVRGADLTAETAASFCVATVDPDEVPNALRAAPGVSRTLGSRLRDTFTRLAWAASILFAGLGLYLGALERRAGAELRKAEEAEAALFSKFLPEVPAKKAEFARAVRLRLKEVGAQGDVAADWPSALSFFAEVARRLPEPEPIGMTLEAIDLSPEGGRLSAAVPVVQGDTLRNAALLEAKLGESPKLGARGDYETRSDQVQVRLRLDFRKDAR